MKAKKFFLRWEWLLVLLIAGVYAFFSWKLPGSYTPIKLLDQTRVYMVDVGFMALGAMLILILGDIDISVASTAALSVTVMGTVYNAGEGLPFGIALALALLVGVVCGAINGLLVTRFKELFPMIITPLDADPFIAVLPTSSSRTNPPAVSRNGSAKTWDTANSFGDTVPVMLVCVLAMFPIFYIWLHRTALRPAHFPPPAPTSPPHAIPACVPTVSKYSFSRSTVCWRRLAVFSLPRARALSNTPLAPAMKCRRLPLPCLAAHPQQAAKAALSACCFRSS